MSLKGRFSLGLDEIKDLENAHDELTSRCIKAEAKQEASEQQLQKAARSLSIANTTIEQAAHEAERKDRDKAALELEYENLKTEFIRYRETVDRERKEAQDKAQQREKEILDRVERQYTVEADRLMMQLDKSRQENQDAEDRWVAKVRKLEDELTGIQADSAKQAAFLQSAGNEIIRLEKESAASVAELKADNKREVERLQAGHDRELERTQAQHKLMLEQAQSQHQATLKSTATLLNNQINELKTKLT